MKLLFSNDWYGVKLAISLCRLSHGYSHGFRSAHVVHLAQEVDDEVSADGCEQRGFELVLCRSESQHLPTVLQPIVFQRWRFGLERRQRCEAVEEERHGEVRCKREMDVWPGCGRMRSRNVPETRTLIFHQFPV